MATPEKPVGRGRGRGAKVDPKKPRRPNDELREKGIVLQGEEKPFKDGGMSEAAPAERNLDKMKDLSIGDEDIGKSQVSFDAIDISSSSKPDEAGATFLKDTNEEVLVEQEKSNTTNSLTYEIFKNAVNTPIFVPRSLIEQGYAPDKEPFPEQTGVKDPYSYYCSDSPPEFENWDNEMPVVDTSSSQFFINPNFFGGASTADSDQQTLDIFQYLLDALTMSPFETDNYLCAVSLLKSWIQDKDTLYHLASMVMNKAITSPEFGFAGGRLVEMLSDVKRQETLCGEPFKTAFFFVAKREYEKAKNMMKESGDDDESIKFYTRLAMFFGELLNSMKIQGKVNKKFREVVLDFVNSFLEHQSEKVVLCATKLLKLTGALLDEEEMEIKAKPGDIKDVFDKVNDLWLNSGKKKGFSSMTINELGKVYKLRTRDWDRVVTPPPASSSKEFEFSSQAVNVPSDTKQVLADEEGIEDYFHNMAAELYGTEKVDEVDDAYEQFLAWSGQV